MRLVLVAAWFFGQNAPLFASTNAADAGVNLSSEERQWITQHPILRVGVLTNRAPFSYVRTYGSLSGIDIDLLNLISQRTGLGFEPIPQRDSEDMAANWDHLDMVPSISKTPLREQKADFTDGYFTPPFVIIEREGDEVFGTLAVLDDKRLAVVPRDITTQIVTNRLHSPRLILKNTQDECFESVAKKKADATVANLFIASQYLNSHPASKLTISGVISKSDEPMRMAVHRDQGLAVSILNKGLASISQHELDDIVGKHLLFGLESRGRFDLLQKRAKQVFMAVAVAGLLLLLWNFFIRKEIRARRKAETELREANESMEIFSHSLSHDLRAPLRGITGFAQILKEGHYEKLDREGQHYLDVIMTSGSQMERLITDVLTYSRATNSKWPMESVELEPLVHQLIEEFPAEQRPCFHIISKLPAVRGNATLLNQSLTNLLSNAVRFVPRDRTPNVIIRAAEKDSSVTVFVEDNGIGVKPKDQQRIFRIFERAAPSHYDGTGIGLAVVAKAAERMDGSVGVQSEIGKGSRFWIRLPIAYAS
jgi:signal transduction histidine kinase